MPPGPEHIGRYLLQRPLPTTHGRRVWLAYDPLLDRQVELQLLADPRRLNALRAVTALNHPTIVPVFDVGDGPQGAYAASAHIEGRPLPVWQQERARTCAEIVEVFLRAGSALTAAHGQGLGHGSFTGAAVTQGWDGGVYVRGFGDALDWTIAGDELDFVVALREALAPLPESAVPEFVRRAVAVAEPRSRPVPLRRLLRRLARDPAATRRRRWVAALAGAATIAACALVAVAPWRAPPCAGASERLAGVWDAPVRERVRAAFAGVGIPEAAHAWTVISRELDGYAGAWLAAHAEACEATHVHEVQTTAELDLRMACLDGRRRELASVAAVLAEADALAVRQAAQAVASLTPIARCGDLANLALSPRDPTDPAERARAAVLAERLARARALRLAGRYAEALELAQAVAADTRVGPHGALAAEAQTLIGLLEARARRATPAEEALTQGAFGALAAGHDLAFSEAATALVSLEYQDRSRLDRSEWWAARARLALERAGRPPELEHALALRLGDVALQQGRYLEAQGHFERALDVTPVDKPATRAIAEDRLGRVHRMLDHPYEALAHHERALVLFEAVHGPHHPNVAIAVHALALALRGAGRLREALAYHRRALALQEATLGVAHPDLAGMETALGITLWIAGDAAGAHDRFASALASYERRFGEDHVTVARLRLNLAPTLLRLGRLTDAREQASRALALTQKLHGADHPETADALTALAQCHLEAGEPRRALELIQRAVAIERAATEQGSQGLAACLVWEGRALLLLGRPSEARTALAEAVQRIPAADALQVAAFTALGRALAALRERAAAAQALERAVALAITTDGHPRERGHAYLALARFLESRPEAGARSQALLEAARTAFASASPRDAQGLALASP